MTELRKQCWLFYAFVFFVFFIALTFGDTSGAVAASDRSPIKYYNSGFTVEIHTAGDAFKALVAFSGDFEFKTFSLSHPDRFVLDVEGVVMDGKGVTLPVDDAVVKAVRVAQFSLDPNIVRVVFDLERPATFEAARLAGNVLQIRHSTGGIGAALPNPRIEKRWDSVDIVFPLPGGVRYEEGRVAAPPRIYVDIYGYIPADSVKDFAVGEGIVRQVRVSHYRQAPDVARVVIDLEMPAAYKVKSGGSGGGFVVTVYQPSVYKKKIVVDAGHGGKDPGAMSSDGTMEKGINLAVALKLAAHLRSAGANVVLTRDSDRFVSLDDRAYIANRSDADVFISVHVNSLPNHNARLNKRGTQTYYYADASLSLAKVMHRNMLEGMGVGDMGMYSKRFAVLRKTRMPAVLCELAYLSHPDDFTLLSSSDFRENAARSIFNGLDEYFGGRGLAMQPVPLPQHLYAYLMKQPTSRASETAVYTEEELPSDLTEEHSEEFTASFPAPDSPAYQGKTSTTKSDDEMNIVIRKSSPTRLDKEAK
ncbi:MAG: N-acetylmuramoyl-L-alanine amidase [bacterium]